jgi:DNA repair protein RadC
MADAGNRLAIGSGNNPSGHVLRKRPLAQGLWSWAGGLGLSSIWNPADSDISGAQSKDEELLAAILDGSDGRSQSQRLIAHFGNLNKVVMAELPELVAIVGTMANAQRIKAAARLGLRIANTEPTTLSGMDNVYAYFKSSMAFSRVETFRVLYLEAHHHLISDEVAARGSPTVVALCPQEILRRALVLDASAMIIAHNHPSNCAAPSPADIEATRQLLSQAKVLGISVHDHLIVTRRHIHSMRCAGTIDPWE